MKPPVLGKFVRAQLVGLVAWLAHPGILLAAEDIVLGMSAAFKGPSRGLGIELYRGSMAYFEHVNRAGGVHGRKIAIKAYDDGYNPIPAVANTIRLIEKDKPFLLYGYVGTPTVARILPLLRLYDDRSIALFFPFTGAQPHRNPPYSDFVFNLRASYRQETAGLVENLVGIGRKRIAVFYQIDAYGRDGWDGVRTALTRRGLRMVGEATYRRGTPYASSARAAVDLLAQSGPDAIVCVGAYAACAAFIRDARDAGMTIPIANISFVGSENLLHLLLETSKKNGKDYTRDLINTQVVPSYNRPDLPAVAQYREFMERYQPMPPAELVDEGYEPLPYSYVGFEGFLNAKLVAEILQKMGKDPKKENIGKIVESLDGFDLGLDVPVSFGPKRHQGLDKVYYTTIVDGRFVRIEDWRPWRK